jgi:osmotically-inducible protein OsmY
MQNYYRNNNDGRSRSRERDGVQYQDSRAEFQNSRRSGYGYEQDMPQRDDRGGYRAQNELEQDREFRGMRQFDAEQFSQPSYYRMDFDRNREVYTPSRDRGPRNSSYDREQRASMQDMRFSSMSSDMPSADRYRTRGADDDGPGLYGGAEDYGHSGMRERFDYGAERYPYPDMNRSSETRSYGRGNGNVYSTDERGSNAGDYSNRATSNDQYQEAGPHRGKGPKNYSRSDDRIREDVCECLMQDAHIDASEVDVRVSSGEVTLTGTVNSKNEKRRAEDAVERVAGIKEVHNELNIEPSTERSDAASGARSTADGSADGQQNANGQSTGRSSNKNSTRVS